MFHPEVIVRLRINCNIYTLHIHYILRNKNPRDFRGLEELTIKLRTKPNYSGNNQARYIAKVISLLRSQIIYQVPAGLKSGEHLAVYTVHLLPDGTQLKPPTLEKSSGLPAFDAAVESAIRRVNPFPPADAGTVLPKTIQITFDPVDNSR